MTLLDLPYSLVEKYNKPGPRYTSYPPVPYWDKDFGEEGYRSALRDVAAATGDPLALYVHLPFCASRCHYCGCNATVTKRAIVVDAYLDRVEHELEIVVRELQARRKVVQLHWGGGTPNFLVTHQISRLFGYLAHVFELDPAAEVSIECDPRIGTPEQLEVLRNLGFNRISFGVQDIDPVVQQAIGRIQPLERTVDLIEAARALGFESVNLDLVYGLPAQTPDSFARTLEAVIGQAPDRIACFSYAHVPWMHANQKQIDVDLLPDPPAKFALFKQAVETLSMAGYTWIGLDHFARHDDELTVAQRERRLHRNFMGYTVMPGAHMLAFGNSAIGELANRFVQNDAKLGAYQRSLDAGRLPVVRGHHMSADDRLRKLAIQHLMCNLELPENLTYAEFGVGLEQALGPELAQLRGYIEEGFVAQEPGRLVVTDLGRYFLRVLCMELDAYRNVDSSGPRFSKTI